MPEKNPTVPKWAFYLVAGVAALALIGVAVLAVVTARSASASKAASTPTEPATSSTSTAATSTSEASAPEATPSAAQDTTTAAKPKEPVAAGVKVTRESGGSFCLVDTTFERDGKEYVSVDYIQLGTEDHGSEDYDIINENKKLRTYELTSKSWIGAYWLCVDLYGESVAEKFDFEGGVGGRGYPLKRADFKQLVAQGQANEHSYWYVQVKDGRVISLVQTYQD